MNWYRRQMRLAMKSQDVQALQQWLSLGEGNLQQLRAILGNIVAHLNKASSVYKEGVRGSNPKAAAQALEILPDLQNLPVLKQLCAGVLQRVTNSADPFSQVVINLAHTVQNATFSPQQVDQFQRIASGQAVQSNAFADEVNTGRLNQFLQSAIYSTKDDAARSLRVIREILQNSVDAALKRMRTQQGHTPQVDIRLIQHGGYNGKFMDLMIRDNGVGMDWNTLSQKFFVYFNSGKSDEPDATGGFGIAKALIQETPEEGWSIDTNGLHSSRFHKNMFMGSRQDEGYQTPRSSIQPDQNGGTVLTLYKVPAVSSYDVEQLASKYATSGAVVITVNGAAVKPKFLLNQLTALDPSLQGMVKSLGKNETEQQIISETISRKGESIADNLGNLSWDVNGTRTQISFHMQRHEYTGRFYCMLNDQYQFDNDYITKADIVCFIKTNARPGTDEYPIDPGRENLREPYASKVNEIKDGLKELLSDVAKNELFKQGLNIFTFNKDAEPMSTDVGIARQQSTLERAISSQLSQQFAQTPPAAATQQRTAPATQAPSTPAPQAPTEQGGGTPAPQNIPQTVAKTPQVVEQLATAVQAGLQSAGPTITPQQRAIATAALQAIREDESKNINIQEKIDEVIEGLTTPANIAIQKNFVGHDVAHENAELTAEILLAWQRVLKLVMNRVGPRARRMGSGKKRFVPGLIYSDECLALYMPPQQGQSSHTIAINPLTIAAIVQPKLFNQLLEQPSSGKAFNEPLEESKEEGDTPTNRLATFLFHEAIHELCHLLHPDMYGYEEFHMHISKMENLCHIIYPEVRNEVKKFMQPLKVNAGKLIRLVARSKKQGQQVA